MNKNDIPVIMKSPGMTMRIQPDFGDMTVAYHELPKGTDFGPLLKGLNNDNCHCPHWGYVFRGAFRFIYEDGSEEVFRKGDVWYAQPGHTAIADEDLEFVEFSPTRELGEVLAHVGKKMAEMSH